MTVRILTDAEGRRIARRPQGFVRHVAFLADAEVKHTYRGVPIAELGMRRVCYFGRAGAFALFDRGVRVGFAVSPIHAALFLLHGAVR